ncbi:MAG: hypothetical protein U9R48_07170 [Chloroflexota bacterium]|nr:hypothetical protein [Chloroflexota bacterium]
MHDIQITIATGLAISLFVIFISGFFISSSQDLLFVFFGFASGLGAAYALENVKAAEARQHKRHY